MEASNIKVEGFVKIIDSATGEIILDKKNAIHYENMSLAIAQSISHRGFGYFSAIALGNGASTIAGTGTVTYFPANIEGTDASLYNQTFEKLIDDNNNLNTTDDRNFMEVVHTPGTTYTDIVIHCFLDYGEPNDQSAFDNTESLNDTYVFNELGIKSYPQNGVGEGKLLSHCIFSPIEKSLNRAFDIIYTIRIFMSE
jgi:hypothetical protein